MKLRLGILATSLLLMNLPVAETHAATSSTTIPASCTSIPRSSSVKKGITLPCLDGKSSITFQALRGPIVVNVWGSWCEPCNQELPYLVALRKSGKVKILGIDVEERNTSSAIKFAIKNQITWPNLYDVDSVTRGLFGMGVPVTWFIDHNGKVIYKNIGVMNSQADLFAKVKKYLGISV